MSRAEYDNKLPGDAANDEPIHLDKLDTPGTIERVLTTASEQNPDVEPELGWRTFVAILAALIGYMAGNICLIVPGNTASAALAEIGGTSVGSFINNGQVIIQASLGPMAGLATDQFGRKWVLTGLLSLALVGSIIAATAKSGPVLLLGVLFAGAGVCSQVISLAVPSEVLPRRLRPVGQGFAQISSAAGGIIAFFVCGTVNTSTDPGGWRKAYWVLAGLIAFAVVSLVIGYNPRPQAHLREPTLKGKLLAIDPIGSLLLCAFVCPLIVGLNFGGNPYPWKSAKVLVPMLIGIASLSFFGLWEWKGTKSGIFHHELFTVEGKRNFITSLGIQAIEGFVFFGFIVFYPLQTSILWESDPLKLAARGSIIFMCYGICAIPFGWYSQRTRRVKDTLLAGFVLFSAGIIGLATATPGSKNAAIVYAVFVGVGTCVPVMQLVVLVQLATPAWLIGTATAIDASARGLGALIGSTIVSAILTNKLGAQIPARIAKAAIEQGAPPASLPAIIGSTAANNATALASAAIAAGIPAQDIPAFVGGCFAALKSAYAYSLRFIWITEIPVIMAGLISIFFLKGVKKELNWIIDAPQERIRHRRGGDEEVLPHD